VRFIIADFLLDFFWHSRKEGIGYDKADNYPRQKRLYCNIVHYYPKPKLVLILTIAGLKINDKIIVQGAHTFLEQEIKTMEIKNKPVRQGKKGEDTIKFKDKVREHDKVFLIK
jgi:hypothetical protein